MEDVVKRRKNGLRPDSQFQKYLTGSSRDFVSQEREKEVGPTKEIIGVPLYGEERSTHPPSVIVSLKKDFRSRRSLVPRCPDRTRRPGH